MTVAPTLERYLASKNISYDVIMHAPTMSSNRTAEACRIPGDRIAKAVVLRDENGFMLAILPASHHIRLSNLKRQLGFNVALATELEIQQLFEECAQGAVRPASAMGLMSLSTTASRHSRRSTWRAVIMRH